MNFKKLLLAMGLVFSAEVIAADINPNDIATSLGEIDHIAVGTQFVVSGQTYEIKEFVFRSQGYTHTEAESKLLAAVTSKAFVSNYGHRRFNITHDKTPLFSAETDGFTIVRHPSSQGAVELFIRSQYPECGGIMLVVADLVASE